MNFVRKINRSIIQNNPTGINSEDKQIGVYFVSKETLCTEENDFDEGKIKQFSEKVLMYFWEYIARIDPSIWFDDNIITLDDLLYSFSHYMLKVFKNIDFSSDI
jgi:hypothetical protein